MPHDRDHETREAEPGRAPRAPRSVGRDPRSADRAGEAGETRHATPRGSGRTPLLRQVGDYAVEGELGRGGMGVVYRARHADGTAVALKVLRPHAKPQDVKRFQLEARLTRALDHPHLLQVHGHGEADGRWYLAMELIEGRDLYTRIDEDGPLEPRRAVELALALASAVESVHALGALHRDIKPHNVLIDDATGRPYLIDFGLARQRSSSRRLTRRGTVLGTPAYMAPEQSSGQGRADERTDVYCLGATLFHMLSGEPPLDPFLLEALLGARRDDPARPSLIAPHVDPGLERVVVRCLAQQPGARYATAADLGTALRLWLDPA